MFLGPAPPHPDRMWHPRMQGRTCCVLISLPHGSGSVIKSESQSYNGALKTRVNLSSTGAKKAAVFHVPLLTKKTWLKPEPSTKQVSVTLHIVTPSWAKSVHQEAIGKLQNTGKSRVLNFIPTTQNDSKKTKDQNYKTL